MLAKLKRFREIIFIAVAVLLAVVYFVISPGIDNVVLHRQGKDVASALPITLAMNQGELFAVDMDITSGIGGDFTLDIHPDDCVTQLRVNGTDLPFRNYPGHCSWNQGFILDKSGSATLLYVNAKYDVSDLVLDMLGYKPGSGSSEDKDASQPTRKKEVSNPEMRKP